MSEIRVLVVDDHDLFRVGLASTLAGEEDIDVVARAPGGRAGVRLAHEEGSGLESVGELSARELDVLKLIARGLDIEAIAVELQVSPRTARNYIASILRKIYPSWPGPEGSSGVREP